MQTITITPVEGAQVYDLYYSTDAKESWNLLCSFTAEDFVDGVFVYEYDITELHGTYLYYEVNAYFEDNGFYSISPTSDYWYMYYFKPNVRLVMLDETYSNTSTMMLSMYNRGKNTIRIYSSGARWIDRDYYSFDRNMYLCDYDYWDATGLLRSISYLDIPVGKSAMIIAKVKGKPTWYDKYTKFYFQMYHDGKYWDTYSSYYYGFSAYVQ